MQHFTVIHDGSDQGWQAAYLAFHISALLGAPLRALLTDSSIDKKVQVEVGGRAAGVVMESRLIKEFSVTAVVENSNHSDGLFVPRHLIPDENTARRFLEALSRPLWLVSIESEMNGMAVLIGNPASDGTMIRYASILSHRIQQPLNGFVHKNEYPLVSKSNPDIPWQELPELTLVGVTAALKRVKASLLLLSLSHFSLVDASLVNCVIFPTA